MNSRVLVTGGAGYIGSHTAVELINAGYEVIIVDNLSNSDRSSLEGIRKITGVEPKFVEADCCDREAMRRVFEGNDFDSVIHFAAYKAVGESVAEPVKYYRNNLDSFLTILELMKEFGRKNVLFSSSATVYGDADTLPVTERTPRKPATSPYGNTKQMAEDILRDMVAANEGLKGIALRYFNPIGAHKSGRIGENPNGIPNNLMPYITQVAIGKREKLNVFGNDYNTADGTGVRDYIHVVDLAKAHVSALKAINKNCGLEIYNVGTGRGYSVLEVVKAFEKANDLKVAYEIKERRPGDIAECYCNPQKIEKELGWKAENDLEDMCRDSWN